MTGMSKTMPVAFGIALSILIPLAQAQSPASFNSGGTPQQSDPQAVAAVETAIRAMGGRAAWRQVGGATADVAVTSKDLPVRNVTWSDDWSAGRARFRRDSAASESTKASMIGSDAGQMHLMPDGKVKAIQRDHGITVLAVGYPAPALILSLSPKYACTFHLGKPIDPRVPLADSDPNEVTVTELCPDSSYPEGEATLTWVFSKTSGLPLSVELPVWGQMYHIVHTQTVSYIAFQTVSGLPVASQLQIRRVSGAIDQLTISNTAFVQGISDKTFQSPN
jgi:hypothetical protein